MNVDYVFQIVLGIFAFILSCITGIAAWFVRKLTGKVEELDDVLVKHEVRLSVAENRMNAIDERLKSIEQKLDRIYLILQRANEVDLE